mgnify:CR=1 FL=1
MVDGLYGPKTDAAIRDFEQAAGLKPSTRSRTKALLQAMVRSPVKLTKATPPSAAAARPMPARAEAAVERSGAVSKRRHRSAARARRIWLRRRSGPSGIIDAETQAAIEKFERERKLPITGLASDRVVRELAAMTGRPLE